MNYNQEYVVSDFAMERMHFYQLQQQQAKKSYLEGLEDNVVQQSMSSPLLKHLSSNSVVSYYSTTPIYKLPMVIQDVNHFVTVSISNQDMVLTQEVLPAKVDFEQLHRQAFESLSSTHGLITLQANA